MFFNGNNDLLLHINVYIRSYSFKNLHYQNNAIKIIIAVVKWYDNNL